MLTGVYCIRHRGDSKRYIGSAARSLLKRMRSHRYRLSTNTHCNEHLQRAWNKYGAAAFVFSILEKCAPEYCLNREQYWIDLYKAADRRFGYNKSPTAGSPLGFKHGPEVGARLSILLKGKKKSVQGAANIRAAKQNITDATRLKMSKYARCRNQEHRDKLANSMLGNKNGAGAVHSEERRAIISHKAKLRWAQWKISGRATEIGKKISASKRS